MPSSMFRVLLGLLSFGVVWAVQARTSLAQVAGEARPVTGLRENPPGTFFLQNARLVIAPGETIETASISIRGSSIVAVGPELRPPAGAEIIDCSGQTIYSGLIDAYHEIDVPESAEDAADHWNGNIMAVRKASTALESVSNVSTLRSQGITVQLIAPRGGIVKGISAAVLLDRGSGVTLVDDDVAQHAQLTVPRDRRRDAYPNSPMGATALLRQVLYDADWYRRAMQAYAAKPSLQRPTRNDDLERLASDRMSGRFVVDAQNERMFVRAQQLATEFSIDLTVRGSGREYRDLQAVVDAQRLVLLPIDFPDAPNVVSEAAANEVSTRDLLHWHFAPENPARLANAGVTFCLTSDGLGDPKDFLQKIRVAVKRGLSPQQALAAVTTTPARWLGIPAVTGRIEAGSLANLVITKGDLLGEDAELLETWVAGKRFQHPAAQNDNADRLADRWQAPFRDAGVNLTLQLAFKKEKNKWSGKLTTSDGGKQAPKGEKDKQEKVDEPGEAKLEKLTRASDRLTAWVDLSKANVALPSGPSRLTMITVGSSDSMAVFSTLTLPDGRTVRLDWQAANEPDDDVQPSDSEAEQADQTASPESKPSDANTEPVSEDESSFDEIIVNYPLGAFGVTPTGHEHSAVLFRGATVWTCDEQGVLENTDVLIVDGVIESIGKSITPPADCQIVNVAGKYLSPGLIDCHSHMATDGGVNESGQAVTAEVRVGDFIDNSDINIYRQLAGGLTTSNILHGSANPIGGQNQVIKLRWGESMDAMKFSTAPAGIKFALGENVKRSNRTERQTRYPASRMGVEQLMRDRFLAAQEYNQAHRKYEAGKWEGLPPRRDLELDAVAEILRGERWIHCHSYRQDEIATLLELLDSFDITIGSLQHILEGYKVADQMRRHGAMASAFSDWWAYKFEVYDAIPDNGAIMHDRGIVVSFNSDSAELARHLNTEAAKAVKYGQVAPEEALKFVTLNPAKQLRIDDRVGSITVGKDADLVVWSGPPLSTLSRCEQTWVDGQPRFTLEQDQALRQRDARWRALLIGRILDKDFAMSGNDESPVEEEERWLRYDEFCGHDHHDGHDHHQHEQHTDQEQTR